MSDTSAQHVLLVCTVGGEPAPIIAAIRRWKPARVLFLATPQTEAKAKTIPDKVSPEFTLGPGAWDLRTIRDGQDFTACVEDIRRVRADVEAWSQRGDGYCVVADFTGGTKCMSAALAATTIGWGVRFSYVGGTERTKDGVGIVVDGRESIVHCRDPWDSLGLQAIDDAVVLFDRGAFASAAGLIDAPRKSVADATRKVELNAFHLLAETYAAWDRFDHKGALSKLAELDKHGNNLQSLLRQRASGFLAAELPKHRDFLKTLIDSGGPTVERIADLLANADRRAGEGRFDDAVARLYRAVEAVAQMRLAAHGIADSSRVPLDKLPETLHLKWKSYADEKGTIKLALQDAFAVLSALGDTVAKVFVDAGLADQKKSPLVARNTSILAHGFEPVHEAVFKALRSAAVKVAGAVGVREDTWPVFPKLGQRESGDRT